MYKNFLIPCLIITLLLVGLKVITLKSTVAKSCALPKSAIEALSKVNAVFVGEVTDVKYIDDPDQNSPEPRIIVKLKVKKVWKGPLEKEFTLHTVFNKWSGDGYFFSKGQEYLVFADKVKRSSLFPKEKGVYEVKLCKGTRYLSESGDYIKELGKGLKP